MKAKYIKLADALELMEKNGRECADDADRADELNAEKFRNYAFAYFSAAYQLRQLTAVEMEEPEREKG